MEFFEATRSIGCHEVWKVETINEVGVQVDDLKIRAALPQTREEVSVDLVGRQFGVKQAQFLQGSIVDQAILDQYVQWKARVLVVVYIP